ncbi:hypothetical protein SAMN05216525_13230 [Bradyrhizobium sp. Gha]|nr:hypothetical protein SAMN05216525_13230 [Bradyrhizobium sp. Gha]
MSSAFGERIGDVLGSIARSAVDGIACDNPERRGVLARDDVPQHSLAIRVMLVGFAPSTAGPRSKILKHQVDVTVQAIGWHNRRRGTHTLTAILCGETAAACRGLGDMAGAAPPARSASQPDSHAYAVAFVPDTLTDRRRVGTGPGLFPTALGG